MHIAEGVLSAPVLLGGAIISAAGIAYGLRNLDDKKIVLAGLLAAVFFVGSLIHIPIGFTSAHLILNGLVGALLGWTAFPAIFTALVLQALLFQYGGITTLGVNTASMGLSAVIAGQAFRCIFALWPNMNGLRMAGFTAGFLGVLLSAFFTACALAFTSEGFRTAAMTLFAAHLPIMAGEGIITMLTVNFIAKVKPAMLDLRIR